MAQSWPKPGSLSTARTAIRLGGHLMGRKGWKFERPATSCAVAPTARATRTETFVAGSGIGLRSATFEAVVSALDEVVEVCRIFGLPDYVIRVRTADLARREDLSRASSRAPLLRGGAASWGCDPRLQRRRDPQRGRSDRRARDRASGRASPADRAAGLEPHPAHRKARNAAKRGSIAVIARDVRGRSWQTSGGQFGAEPSGPSRRRLAGRRAVPAAHSSVR